MCWARVGSRALGWRQEDAPVERLSKCAFTLSPRLPLPQEIQKSIQARVPRGEGLRKPESMKRQSCVELRKLILSRMNLTVALLRWSWQSQLDDDIGGSDLTEVAIL